MSEPHIEVQDIFRQYGTAYRKTYALPLVQLKTMSAVARCRSQALGGHIHGCTSCGHQKNAYNSCRNRHCPKCQTEKSMAWLDKRQGELLSIPYFHIVFTIPRQLNPMVLRNQKVLCNILFQSAWGTLKTLCQDPKYFGGQAGAIGVLHTWGQNLMDHPHVHFIVPGGTLLAGKKVWSAAKPDFFLPVPVMRKLFRDTFLYHLDRVYGKGKLKMVGKIAYLENPACFAAFKDQLYRKKWVVYAKQPFAGPKQVLQYLSRYTHRVAIGNHRITAFEKGEVSFRHYNYKTKRTGTMILPALEFIRRFMMHVLPKRFVRIKHFGFLGNRFKKENIARIRELLGQKEPEPQKKKKTAAEILKTYLNIDIFKCPNCGQSTLRKTIKILPVPFYNTG